MLNKIKRQLPRNVSFKYLRKKNSPTIVKRRFLDNISYNKVLGVYNLNDNQLSIKNEQQLLKKLIKLIPRHDLVIVSDYGHGFINKKIANKILSLSSFIALNAQINSSNVSHHSIGKYKKVECVIINSDELRHELRDKDKNIKFLMKSLCRERNIINLIVTQGYQGAILYNSKKDTFLMDPMDLKKKNYK